MSHDADATCMCVAEHRPPVSEYERHHVWPLYLGGPDTDDATVWVCPSCHTNTHQFLRLMLRAGRALSDTELQGLEERPVSRYAARLARLGYTTYREALP